MKKWHWALIFLAAIGLRVFVATLGHTSDTYSFFRTARFVADGNIIYATYHKYNYGPIWSYVLAGIVEVMSFFGQLNRFNFHLVLAGVLSLVDIGLAVWLKKRAGTLVAMIFLFNPVTVLLTGYHSQFDSVALLCALIAWDMISNNRIITGSMMLGLSLSLKHIFFMFPIWTLFVVGIGSLRKRLLVPIIAYGCFFLSFLPFMIDDASRAGVIKNVFLYSSRWRGNSLLYWLTNPIVQFFEIPVPTYMTLIKLLFMGCLMGLGIVFALRAKTKDLAVWYSVALLVTTSAVAHHYLCIPLVACALFYRSIWPWAYTGFVLVMLATSKNNIGSLEVFGDWQIRGVVPTVFIQMTLLALIIWESGVIRIGQKKETETSPAATAQQVTG